MAKLNFLLICDTAFVTKDSNNLNLIGIFDSIGVSKFPAIHSRFSVAYEIETEEETPHVAELVIKREDIEIDRKKIEFTEKRKRIIQHFRGFEFTEGGKYIFEIYLDDELLRSICIKVFEE